MSEYIPAKIPLFLGYNCNLHCRHCVTQQMTNKDMRQDLNVFYNQVQEEVSKQIYNSSCKMSIIFLGGEPLIYFNKLKNIVNYLRSVYGDIFIFCMTTNGVLLDEEKINYFNEYNIKINVSYDGYDSKYLRGFDVLKEREDLLYRINNLSIASVISAYNYPYDCLESLIPFCTKYYNKRGYYCNISISIIRDYLKSFQDYYAISPEKWSQQIQQILHSNNFIIKYFVQRIKTKNQLMQGLCYYSSKNKAEGLKRFGACKDCNVINYCHEYRGYPKEETQYCKLLKLTYQPFIEEGDS